MEAFFIITLTFTTATSPSNVKEISKVIQTSVEKILFHAQMDDEVIVVVVLDSSCEKERECEITLEVCIESCTGKGEEPGFLAFVGNTLKEVETKGQLSQTIYATADHMDVTVIDHLVANNPVEVQYEFEFDSWPTTFPTTSPSLTSIQDCDTPVIVQNLFSFILQAYSSQSFKDLSIPPIPFLMHYLVLIHTTQQVMLHVKIKCLNL